MQQLHFLTMFKKLDFQAIKKSVFFYCIPFTKNIEKLFF